MACSSRVPGQRERRPSPVHMRTWSIPVGRLFGIELRLHLTFVFLLAFVWFTDQYALGASGAARGLALFGIVFGSVLLHEMGHALMALRYNLPVRGIILLPIGGVTLMEDPFQLDEHPPNATPGTLAHWQRD